MIDEQIAELDRLIAGKPELPPARIYGWLNTQMSIARFYGGMTYQGHRYSIAYGEPGDPLVRDDVLKREAKTKRDAEKAQRLADKELVRAAQEVFL